MLLRRKLIAIAKTCTGLLMMTSFCLSMQLRLLFHLNHCFSFGPHRYPYNTYYTGRYQFKKHYYQNVGDLKSDGEEVQCAQFIDTLPEVKFWVRNLERKTATFLLAPDFNRQVLP